MASPSPAEHEGDRRGDDDPQRDARGAGSAPRACADWGARRRTAPGPGGPRPPAVWCQVDRLILPARTRATSTSGPATQQDEDGCRQLDQQGGGPEPDARSRPGHAEQKPGRAPGVVVGQELQTLHIGLRQDDPGVHHDARIEHDVDRPHEHPGHQRPPAPVGASSAHPRCPARSRAPPRRPRRPRPRRGSRWSAPRPPRRTPRRATPAIARSRRRNQRTRAHETSTVVRAKGRSTPSRCPRPSTTGSRSQSNAATTPDQTPKRSEAERVEGEGQQPALEQRHQTGGERDAVHGAGPDLRLDEAGAVGALVVDVPVPVGRHDRTDGQDGQRGQHLEQGWVLGIVRQVVVEDGGHPRRHVDRLVERGRVAPRLEATENQEGDEGDEDHRQPEMSCPGASLSRPPGGGRLRYCRCHWSREDSRCCPAPL